ncbi:hypothetical protein C2S53_016232 [Perilla frutescens var. hirtella]|uniref:TPX2 C-terminal domain-containing protein n=1 Tax=Perilla frutescens var. hirtella TaxID=608512 RepID=A0AAD4J9H7_PERFH|nr:hypothetical protein C2S53_016232 [Perilla frutescens var. hirtella]
METLSKFTGAVVTPTKERAAASMPTKSNDNQNCTENFDPNVCSLNQPAKKKIRERKFVIAKKNKRNPSAASADCDNCGKAAGESKCLCLAHEEFFNNEHQIQNFDRVSECEIAGIGDERSERENGESSLKRNRERLLEEARQSVPESGRVMHLVKAFEKLLLIPKSVDSHKNEENNVLKWGLPGLQQPPEASKTRISSSSSDFYLTSESLGLDSRLSFSLDGSRGSLSSRTTANGRKSRPSSSGSSRTLSKRQWKTKQQKAISQKPFTLTAQQRGRYKEEELTKKLQKKLGEEDKLRIPVAQGLPKTIDEPEILGKPPVKDKTKPVDLVLHSDTRALERAEFDNQVATKKNLMEQYKMEMERKQKLEEEEEIRRLRKELIPKALPMPYFDRPFVPKRSVKHLTIPKEPKFHLPQHKNKKIKCCMSLDDLPTQLE